jgi:AraC-like DNA-binding protein
MQARRSISGSAARSIEADGLATGHGVRGAGVERARAYLYAHPTRPATLGQLAHMAGLSKYHFLRVFAYTFGMSPHALQMRLRLELARRYIEEGRPLVFIAYDTGFADQSHLTRRFKSRFGVTPGRYRRRSPVIDDRVRLNAG